MILKSNDLAAVATAVRFAGLQRIACKQRFMQPLTMPLGGAPLCAAVMELPDEFKKRISTITSESPSKELAQQLETVSILEDREGSIWETSRAYAAYDVANWGP